MISIQTAFEAIRQTVDTLPDEQVALDQTVGRLLSRAVTSDVDSPPHDKSVMDGFAVQSHDIAAGRRRLQVVQTIVAGDWPSRPIRSGQAARIMTGAPLPAGADAVVMVEQAEFDESDPDRSWVNVLAETVPAGKHIMNRAAAITRGEVVFAAGHRIRPSDIGLLAEVGAATVTVGRRPAVAVLATGDELVEHDQIPQAGQIRNSNGPMLTSMAASLLGRDQVRSLGIGRDQPRHLEDLIAQGLQADMLLLSGGVSAGLLDLLPSILDRLGVRQVFHGVAIKPGKPIWFGVLQSADQRCCVFALPGNPVSSLVGFHLFVRMAINCLMGSRDGRPTELAASLASAHSVRGNRTTYWPGSWINDDQPLRCIAPLDWQGSSDLRSLGRADALIHFPADQLHRDAGDIVQTIPLDHGY